MSNIIDASNNAYDSLSNWSRQVATVANQAQTLEEYNEGLNEIGDFNFQNGESYFSSLNNLAFGELRAADKNKDGSISYEEFVELGKKEYAGAIPEDVMSELIESGEIMLDFFAKDPDINDAVTLKDLQLFYSLADESLESEENKRIKDGIISQEDLEQARETMLHLQKVDDPELQSQLDKRADLLELLSYDLDSDGLVQKEEYMLIKKAQLENGNTPEGKAGAYCVFDALDSALGNTDGVLDENELRKYVDIQYENGRTSDEMYNHILEANFTSSDIDPNDSNRKYYEEVLGAYQSMN